LDSISLKDCQQETVSLNGKQIMLIQEDIHTQLPGRMGMEV